MTTQAPAAPAKPAPSPEARVAGLIALLDVTRTGDDAFIGRRKPGGVGRVFGGQVIAQALAAAQNTVDADRPAHSLHAYFLRGGSEDHEIEFTVHRDLDGGSFSNRRVVASQPDSHGAMRPILTLSASFQRREDGVHHQDRMPDVPQPEDLPDEADLRREAAEGLPPLAAAQVLAPRPLEMRPVEPRHWMNPEPRAPLTHTWLRAVAPLPDDPALHRAVLAYASDMALLGTCVLPHGLSWANSSLVSASLDHAVWFHNDVRMDDWVLYACDSPWAEHARGFNRGRFYSRDGRLLASTTQEGMIRRRDPAKGRKPG